MEDKKGARDGSRTRDPNLGKVVLYQLSYSCLFSGHKETAWVLNLQIKIFLPKKNPLMKAF